jgi:putative NADPH-quinone reductase
MKTALIFSHPHFEASAANRALIEAVRDLPDVEIAHLETLYPDGRIDLEAEVERLLGADRIVMQFPMYWYSTPPMLKAWQDQVLTPLLYLRLDVAARLAGKPIQIVTTTAGEADAYVEGGRNGFTVAQLFTPLRAMANRSGFVWEPPFVVHDVRDEAPETLALHAARYRALLATEALAEAA